MPDRVPIHFIEAGAGPALVLLHGFPLRADMWQKQVDALAKGWRVIAPDFRGFKRQSADPGPFTLERLADDVHLLAKDLRLGSFVLGGLSMGGYVALAYVRKYASTTRGLILADTQAAADTDEQRANRDRMIGIALEEGAKPIADAMLKRLIPEQTAIARPQLVKQLRDMMETARPQTLAHALAAMRDRPDQTELLGQIRMPTLLIVGEHDAITPPTVMEKMAAEIPDAGFKVITGAGHMSPMEQPSQVNAAMREFLAGIPGPA
jgi:pimeloyl-ACP methyl ester carboxylesterase